MQASELYDLITNKLYKNRNAHYNVGRDRVLAFSPPGDEYYTIIEENLSDYSGIVVEYHTPTHYYTLNNAFLHTTADLHNQFRTIMRSNNITVATCEVHETVTLGGEEWIYNVWAKPYTGCSNVWADIISTSKDNDGLINNFIVRTIKTLNVLADQPLGSKIWPKGWYYVLDFKSYYSNGNEEWYWQPPLCYTNQYQTDTHQIAQEAAIWVTDEWNKHMVLNPHIYSNPALLARYSDDLNKEVFGTGA